MPGKCRLIFKLCPEMTDMYTKIRCIFDTVPAPYLIQQFPLGYDTSEFAAQYAQNFEFNRREMYRTAILEYFPCL